MIEVTLMLFSAVEVGRLGEFMQTLEDARLSRGLKVGHEMPIPVPTNAPDAAAECGPPVCGVPLTFRSSGSVAVPIFPSASELEAALRIYLNTFGFPSAQALLQEFGAARIGDVPAERTAEFYARMTK